MKRILKLLRVKGKKEKQREAEFSQADVFGSGMPFYDFPLRLLGKVCLVGQADSMATSKQIVTNLPH